MTIFKCSFSHFDMSLDELLVQRKITLSCRESLCAHNCKTKQCRIGAFKSYLLNPPNIVKLIFKYSLHFSGAEKKRKIKGHLFLSKGRNTRGSMENNQGGSLENSWAAWKPIILTYWKLSICNIFISWMVDVRWHIRWHTSLLNYLSKRWLSQR